jgi:hypothetical protein
VQARELKKKLKRPEAAAALEVEEAPLALPLALQD